MIDAAVVISAAVVIDAATGIDAAVVIDAAAGIVRPMAGWLVSASLQAAVFALVVWLADRLLRRRASPEVLYGLWMLVAVRLLLPPSLSAPWTPWAHLATRMPGLEGALSTASGPTAGTLRVTVPPAPDAWTALSTALLVVWALGAVAFGATVWHRNRRMRRLLTRGAVPASPAVTAAAGRAAHDIGLRRMPSVVLHEGAPGPLVTGCWRPVVVLPRAATFRWGPAELEHVLCHELAHIRRGDLWAEAGFALLNALYWFHPLVWLARRRAAELRELCCDTTAARAAGPGYRHTLTRIAVDTLLGEARAGAVGLKGGRSAMLARLRQLERRRPITVAQRLLRAAALLAFAVMLLPMAAAAPGGGSADASSAIEITAAPGGGSAGAARAAEIAAARHTIEAAIDKQPGFGSLHARYALMRWNALRAASAPDASDEN